ncbi:MULTISPECIES: MBL fold metallo-hydrolase [Odoribacteraceae]|uniref:MBL fold metallo-hydrolase n=1 Tax=Odoribacteraceae TaxID=1853231 RepID=UPI000E517991|nr:MULTISPECIES: MBL fold metallo-hydrolase [Odoribacteraceae]MCQ4874954.1 MBL fold metallo-hydrolase [Butyricimonas paravirosa]RHR82987.1 MBL fold metallo-hydrolase [Odoribacter sp. AF15-53]
MKVTILGSGTSQGVPVIACDCEVCRSTDEHDKRLRCSAMIDIGEKKLIIDAGPDFRTQMLRAGVKDVTALLLTHEHKDHIGGLDDIRAFNWVKNGEVDIYCNQRTKDVIYKDYDYAFAEFRYPGVPEMNIHVIDEAPFHIDDIEVIPVTVMHYRLPVSAFRIGNFAYVTDANFISEESMKKLEGVEYMVINALRKEIHLSHFTLNQAIQVVQRLNVKQAYITHIGHQMGLHEQVSLELPENVKLAYDMLTFEF